MADDVLMTLFDIECPVCGYLKGDVEIMSSKIETRNGVGFGMVIRTKKYFEIYSAISQTPFYDLVFCPKCWSIFHKDTRKIFRFKEHILLELTDISYIPRGDYHPFYKEEHDPEKAARS